MKRPTRTKSEFCLDFLIRLLDAVHTTTPLILVQKYIVVKRKFCLQDVIAAKNSANVAANDPTIVTRRSFDAGVVSGPCRIKTSELEVLVTLLPTRVRFEERLNGRSDLRV